MDSLCCIVSVVTFAFCGKLPGCEIVRAFQIFGDSRRLVFIILENILRACFTVYPSGLKNCGLNEGKDCILQLKLFINNYYCLDDDSDLGIELIANQSF